MEKIRDLFDPSEGNKKLRNHPTKGPYVEGLKLALVASFEEVEQVRPRSGAPAPRLARAWCRYAQCRAGVMRERALTRTSLATRLAALPSTANGAGHTGANCGRDQHERDVLTRAHDLSAGAHADEGLRARAPMKLLAYLRAIIVPGSLASLLTRARCRTPTPRSAHCRAPTHHRCCRCYPRHAIRFLECPRPPLRASSRPDLHIT